MPCECLCIIESKSKVRYSRNKPVVAKASTTASTSGISPDVAELKDMVRALLLDKKDMVKALLFDMKSQNQAPATVKAVKESCVTCGGAHSYRNCPATDGNVYRDNIQEFVSQASAVNYNQGNTSYRPPMMSHQIRPPGFPLVPNNQNVQLNQRNNQNRFNQNQNQGNNFNHAPVYQPSVFQPPAYQAPAYQAPAPQTQGDSRRIFQPTSGLMMRASTSSSGTLSSNIIANPRSVLKAITTRSGVSYDGPQVLPPPSFLPNVVKNEPEATKDTVNHTNNESTEDVQPMVVQSEFPILTSEPVNSPIIEPVASPVSASRSNQRPSVPYPSRLQDQKLRDKANDQCEKFFQIFKDLNFNISFADALILMPKFSPSIKSLLTNKDKLGELARTPLNEHCSAVFLKKLPEKLGDLGKFLIPCDFPGKAECLALANLGASINLMPLSVWNKLSLLDLTPTHFDADPRVPLILRRPFLKIGRALIDVFEGELTLRVGKEAITFNLYQTSRYSTNYNDMTAKHIEVIDMACEEYSQEALGFSDVIACGNPTPYYDLNVSTTSPTLTPFENSDFLLEEVDVFLALEDDPTSPKVDQSYLDSEGDILLLETFLNDDPPLPPLNQGNYLAEVRKELKICDDKLPVIIVKNLSMEEKTALITVLKSHKRAIAWKLSDIKGIDPEFCTHKILMEDDFEPARVCIDYQKLNEATRKDHFSLPFMDQMLERLAGNQYYCFLDGLSGYFQISIDSKDQEKTTFTCPYRTFAYHRMPFGLCNASGTFQSCLSHLERMLKRCEDTNLCLNWDNSHFMVKEGIVLGHIFSKERIEVDKAKVDVITKLPHPTTVKGKRTAGIWANAHGEVGRVLRHCSDELQVYGSSCGEGVSSNEKLGLCQLGFEANAHGEVEARCRPSPRKHLINLVLKKLIQPVVPGAKKPCGILLLKLESLGKDASKQGRRIDAIDADKDITLVNDVDNEMFDMDILDCKHKNKKSCLVQKRLHYFNKPPTKAQQRKIMYTYLNKEGYKLKYLKLKEFDSIQKMFDKAFKRVNILEEFRTKLVEGKEKREGIELEKEINKKQKVEDDKEKEELKQLMETISRAKTIHKEGKKNYYQIVRADGKSQMYMIFSQMLKSFNRENLEDLLKFIRARYGSTRPVENMDCLLWSDMKIMVEPHVQDKVWKLQKRYKVLEWKLYDSCRVHSLMMKSMQIYMLVEKKYPLTPPILLMMLEKKLQIDYESEMAY
nr:hypothetical protein [Tanacetum cinerariifolium]